LASENAVAQQIVDAAYRVHTTLGPGLLESVYEAAMVYELEKRGLRIARQQAIPVVYESVRVHTGFRADLVVAAHQLQRRPDRRWHHPHCQRTPRVISREDAKAAKMDPGAVHPNWDRRQARRSVG
jgi:PD-(D/E)XK nuclease superfamily